MSETTNNRDNPGVIAPPPLIFLAGTVLGLLLHWLLPLRLIPDALQVPVALVPLIASVILGLSAAQQFIRAGTHLEPNRPSTAIVTSGPYRFTRNPIYLAMALFQTGIGIMVDGVWVLLLLIPVLLVVNYGIIMREERYLERKFGDEYRRYKQSVRRWI
ncbi:MAG: isoprenylcysteine carboxylmethyltransferase family protein [Burkholderiales bacterium]|nr:isoprenylcysteine carboxylmethyltransferase family protein [Anaerolineae bacterium]